MSTPRDLGKEFLQRECKDRDPVCAGFTRCGRTNHGHSSAQCEILCATGKCPLTDREDA